MTVSAAEQRIPYHRLARRHPSTRWGTPLAVAAIAGGLYFIFSVIVLAIVQSIAGATLSGDAYDEYFLQATTNNVVLTHPLAIVLRLSSIATMLPALLLARLIMRSGGLGTLSSVAGRIRWRWFRIALIPAGAYLALQLLIGYVISPAISGESLGEPTAAVGTFVAALVVILLLVPVQATAEEYVFRGFVLQAVGTWWRWPALAIALSVVPFVFGHAYNVWGLLEVLTFALVAAWLSIRTGGLEAAIGVHILSNVGAFGLPALGFTGIEVADGSPAGFLVAAVLLPAYAFAVVRLFTRLRLSPVASPVLA